MKKSHYSKVFLICALFIIFFYILINRDLQVSSLRNNFTIMECIFLLGLILTIGAFYIYSLRRKEIEKLLKSEHDFAASIIDNADMVIAAWKIDGTCLLFNKYAEKLTGFKQEEVIGKDLLDITVCDRDKKELRETIIEKKGLYNESGFIRCKDGGLIDIYWKNSLLYNSDNAPDLIISMGIDTSETKKTNQVLKEKYEELEATYEQLVATEEQLFAQYVEVQKNEEELAKSEERHRLIVEASNDGIWDKDLINNVNYNSPKIHKMLGLNYQVDSEEKWVSLIHPEDVPRRQKIIDDYLNKKIPKYYIEYRIRKADGTYLWVLDHGKALWNEEGKPYRMAGSLTDITAKKEYEQKIERLAFFDALTGLYNRIYFESSLKELLEKNEGNPELGALLLLDLDDFKIINDSCGHDAGDQLLKMVALTINELMKDKIEYIFARMGGDEFFILFPHIKSPEDIEFYAQEIIDLFQKPWYLDAGNFYTTCSIGITYLPEDGMDVQTLYKNADLAMYEAKDKGKNQYRRYRPEMNGKIINKLAIENDLRRALDTKQFEVFYQPIIDVNTGETASIEALLRWRHPEKGMISPLEFVPIAEETGLIVPIGEFVLREACRQCKEMQLNGAENLKVSVNFSLKQFQFISINDNIKRILEEEGLAPHFLTIEITESIAMSDLPLTLEILKGLQKMGVSVALDDFGTGYSSLNYLQELPVDCIKIDRSFIQKFCSDDKKRAIATTIISLAHTLGINVVAEGVEKEEQLNYLREAECDLVQGYYYSQPLASEKINDYVRSRLK